MQVSINGGSGVYSDPGLAPTIPKAILVAADRYGDKIAVVDGDRRMSYRRLADEMMVSAGAFLGAGLAKGERVAIWAPNGLDWIVVALGVQAAGGCIVPLNTRFKG